jgi:glycosyltransferase involved in cell wall biosynthesis
VGAEVVRDADAGHRARVEVVDDDADRPTWSVMIPAYNCEAHIGQAIESVLAQDPGPETMQIEVVDDDSGDATVEVASSYGERVSVYQQPRNLGNVGNFNSCLNRARGRVVHLLHGDDAVREGFYERLGEPFDREPSIGAAFCRYVSLDEDGNWTGVSPLEASKAGVLPGWAEKLALGQRLQPPCIVVRRDVYERLRGFDDRISYSEDWEMWTRIAASYPVWHEPEPLAFYRVHDGTITDGALRTGAGVADLRRTIAINRRTLPSDRVDGITRRALQVTAVTALRRGRRRLGAGDTEAAASQLREALKTSRSPRVLAGAAFLQLLRVRRWILVRAGLR